MFKQSAKKIWMPAVWIVAIAIVAAAGIAGSSHVRARSARTSATQVPASASQSGRMRSDLDALPLAFEANQGQTDPQVKYMARGKGYTAFLTADETVFAMQSPRANAGIPGKRALLPAQKTGKATKDETAAIRMKLVGANENAPIAAEKELPGHSNYFIGNDRTKWHAGVKQYARVSYNHVYPGVNLAFHGQQKQLEFDFIVAPGADPKAIHFDVSGAKKISTDSTGNLVLASAVGDVVLHKPVTYQTRENTQQAVESRFVVAKNTVSFEVGNYDRRRELVIDPAVSYATYLGGAAEDDAYAIAVDGSGAAYVTGQTASTSFPGASGSPKGGFDVFVSKIAPTGISLDYSTFVGGSKDDSGISIAVDGSGSAYVVGGTKSTDFASTGAGFQPAAGGGSVDAFVFELQANSGLLQFASYLGGAGDDIAYGVAVDSAGVYIAGTTSSPNLQTTGAFQPALQGSPNGFVAKVNTSGSTKLYFSYLGRGGESLSGVDVDSNHVMYVTGSAVSTSFPVTAATAYQKTCKSCPALSDAFVTVINPAGGGSTDLVYSTFVGGSQLDQGLGIAVDRPSGKTYITGVTESGDFPVSSSTPFGGTQNAFVTALNPTAAAGQQRIYSTYLGGTKTDFGAAIALDSSQTAYVTGETDSPDFPVAGAPQASLKGGTDAFVSEISPSGQLLFSTFLGGSGNENQSGAGNLTGLGAIAVDPAGSNIYVAGNTTSSDFPATSGANVQPGGYAGAGDAYVAKFSNTGFSITNGALSPTSGHAGVAANATIAVASTGGFAGKVQLACSVSPGPAKAPTCSLSPASVTLTANGSPQNATLSVATAAAAARLEYPFDGRGVFFATIVPVFGLTLVGAGMGSSDSRRRKLFGLFLLGIIAMSLLLMPACSSSSTTVGGGNGGTPAGAYTITVTGTSGGASATGSPAITLTIN